MHLEGMGETRCEETRGFLFTHACGQLAVARCGSCGKPVCSMHQKLAAGEGSLPGAINCTSCAMSDDDDDDSDSDSDSESESDSDSDSDAHSSTSSTDDDPYFYSSHYEGYGYRNANEWQQGSSTTGGDVHANEIAEDGFFDPEPGDVADANDMNDPNDFTEADGESVSGDFGGGGDFGDGGDFETEISGS